MAQVEVIRDIDELNRRTWRFWYHNTAHTLYLDGYYEETRATKRHKFKVEKSYNRLARHSNLSVDDAPLPPDVIDEARRKFVDTLKIEKWNK